MLVVTRFVQSHLWLICFALFILPLLNCSGSSTPSDCDNPSSGSNCYHSDLLDCTSNDLFTVYAVPLTSIAYVSPIGIMAPVGGSPLPKGHTGFMLNAADVEVRAPGEILINRIRETTYLVSPSRQGYSDYSLYFDVCAQVGGHFGHLSSLSSTLSQQLTKASNCEEYLTVDETIRSCEGKTNIVIPAGEQLGTAGAPPHSPALDMGMVDSRLNDYLHPSRYSQQGGRICPWDWHVDAIKTELYALIGGAFGLSPDESPKCGSMAIDVDHTAKGRWTLQSNPADGSDPTAGDFFVLTMNPYAPESQAIISTRIGALNTSSLPEYQIAPSGRLNIHPKSITANGWIYCYDQDLSASTFSYLVQLLSNGTLKVEKLNHAAGASSCNQLPSTWAFSSASIHLIR